MPIKVAALPVVNMAGFNFVLLVVAFLLLVWYALWANYLGSAPYQENILKSKFSGLLEEENNLLSQKSSVADLGRLLSFVRRAGLQEQTNPDYIFEQSGLAQAVEKTTR